MNTRCWFTLGEACRYFDNKQHGWSCLDISKYRTIWMKRGKYSTCFAEWNDRLVAGESVLGYPVLGGEDVLPSIFEQGVRLAVNAVGGIGNIQSRINIFQRLKLLGFQFPILIHPSAVVEPSASLSPGVQVFPHAYIGSETRVGHGAIINSSAVISHDCEVGVMPIFHQEHCSLEM